uniref:DUF4219 domain-containing protein/UBN2 domain-containing protein n=1 Tax=Tanacetum cinerariifolium TaxID=118510 RepID=A0A6L2MY17_TANCI|nr:hypothetical protein [Tanacetum cinerariifolium]
MVIFHRLPKKDTQVLEVVLFEEQSDDLKKKLAKNNEAKMVLYYALPKKEYERVFMCKTAKDIWQSLLITHQGNSQVEDNKIDLLVQQYEQFTILKEESIDSGFVRFNTIITSLNALDEESKDLSSLALDELISNLKVHEVVMEKDSEIYRRKKERVKSIALKTKKESSDDETLTSKSDDEEYTMAVRNFKSSLEERINLLGNQEKKESHSDKRMRRKEIVIKNALDMVIQIISLEIVQNHLTTKIKNPSLEVLRVMAKMTLRTKLMMKLVSWLSRQMRTKPINFVVASAGIVLEGSIIKAHGSTIPRSVDPSSSEKAVEHIFSPPMSSRSDVVITRKKLINNKFEESKKPSLKQSLKSGLGYVKTKSRSKIPPPRRNNFSQPRHNIPQPRRNYREPIHQNFYPMNWNNNHVGNTITLSLHTSTYSDEKQRKKMR